MTDPSNAQLTLDLPSRGGARRGAGRKAAPGRKGLVPHARRPAHRGVNPVHVTMRAVSTAPDLRAQRPFRGVKAALAHVARRGVVRVVHFSVQRDHIHVIVEAADGRALGTGLQLLWSLVARAVNLTVGRRGRLWRDRYHRHDLTSPRQVRNALVYVLFNFRKHMPEDAWEVLDQLDPRSSAIWFDGWHPRAGPLLLALQGSNPEGAAPLTVEPRTWLASKGWRRLGLIRPEERPLS
jgi:putative transposase